MLTFYRKPNLILEFSLNYGHRELLILTINFINLFQDDLAAVPRIGSKPIFGFHVHLIRIRVVTIDSLSLVTGHINYELFAKCPRILLIQFKIVLLFCLLIISLHGLYLLLWEVVVLVLDFDFILRIYGRYFIFIW